jgi:hypothetical protein
MNSGKIYIWCCYSVRSFINFLDKYKLPPFRVISLSHVTMVALQVIYIRKTVFLIVLTQILMPIKR